MTNSTLIASRVIPVSRTTALHGIGWSTECTCCSQTNKSTSCSSYPPSTHRSLRKSHPRPLAITRTANFIDPFPTEIQHSPENFVDLVNSSPSHFGSTLPSTCSLRSLVFETRSVVAMRDKREPPNREPDRRGPRAVQDYDERMPRRKPKAAGPQDDRDRDSLPPKYRSMAIRPHERERDRDSISYYQSRSGHASKTMSSEEAQKAIRTLFKQVKEDTSFFANFREDYEREIRGVEAYAGEKILEKLWGYKIEHNCETTRSSKGRSKDDGAGSGLHPGFDDVSNQLWHSLHDAYDGARSFPSGQNDSMARKLEAAKKEVCTLLSLVRTRSGAMEGLIRELKLLKVVLELGGAGKTSHDDRANQRPGAHTSSHSHPRDSSLGGARYGGMTEHSGSEDDGQRDEQDAAQSERSHGREEREVDGDGEGQGPFPTDQSVWLATNVQQVVVVVTAGEVQNDRPHLESILTVTTRSVCLASHSWPFKRSSFLVDL